ncbi:MAG TPA: IS3 family transposase [Gammaproteobacteria bacterium]|nr:IS3 family transposase [Gammaproteobacteria bacterium]
MLRTASPLASICRVLELPRSTLYYQAQPRDDREVGQAIEAVAQQFPTYGGRRIAAQVRRAPYGLCVNRQRAQRVMRRMGLLRRTRSRQQRTTDSRHGFRRFPSLVADRVASAPDEIWVSDLTYVRLGADFISLAVIMIAALRGGPDRMSWRNSPPVYRRPWPCVPVMHHAITAVQFLGTSTHRTKDRL